MLRDIRSGFSITELVLLALLAEREMYSLEIVKAIAGIISGGRSHLGIVYPLLKDCVREGWISERTEPKFGRNVTTFYLLTQAGKDRLKSISTNWTDVNSSVVVLLTRALKTAAIHDREATLPTNDAHIE